MKVDIVNYINSKDDSILVFFSLFQSFFLYRFSPIVRATKYRRGHQRGKVTKEGKKLWNQPNLTEIVVLEEGFSM